MPVGAWDIDSTSGLWELWPDPQHPTIPPSSTLEGKAHTDIHRRMGLIMGVVTHGTKHLWNLEWQYISTAEVSTLKDWWETQYFQFAPTYDTATPSSSTFYNVVWTEKEFKPVAKRGGYFSLSATLEQV